MIRRITTYRVDTIDQLIELTGVALRDEDVSYARSLAAALKAAQASGREVDAKRIGAQVVVDQRVIGRSEKVKSIVLERVGSHHRWRLNRMKAPGIIRRYGLAEVGRIEREENGSTMPHL